MRVPMIAAAALCLTPMGYGVAATGPETNPVVAQLTDIQPNVLVDIGKGFVPRTKPLAVKVGDRIVVNGKGSAWLVYAPDCKFHLEAPSTTVVDERQCVVGTQEATGGAGAGGFGPLAAFALSLTPIAAAGAAEAVSDNGGGNAASPDGGTGLN